MERIRKHVRQWVSSLPDGTAKHFYQWLSFRLMVAFGLFTAAVIVFAKLANEVREQDTLGIDRTVLLHIHALFGSKPLDYIVPITTDIGGTIGIIALTAIFVGTCARKRMYNRALLVLVGTGGAVILNLILKSMFTRVRPELWDRLIIENGFSFPSGHAMGSSALALSIIAALWHTRWRAWAIIVGALYVLYVGFTRLYLGVHYPTDIIGGWVISFAWVILVYGVLGSLKLKPHQHIK